MKSHFIRTVVIAGFAAGGLFASVATATAAPVSAVAAPTASPASVSSAPTCVYLYQTDYIRDGKYRSLANAKNNCTYPIRTRMIWVGTTDGGCFSLNPGQDHGESKPGTAPYVSELRDC
ncbi:hypothetical protein [Streptomyces sp. H39-S7]|uniref:hypothetical protein n=1 Tax=Streptomyces sp. H39-S7 TaxID=3004357 RepID=UPI0022AF81DA|nr:hypothetical protein [Streptomyces sp. H39-S7]MCZ4123649.1 hypothetical protein [Streptomyces sp. H39-S7]